MGPTLVVMAAGIGSRYGGLKQMDPIGPGGEIVIDYSIYDAIKAGFGKVVFVIRRDIEKLFKEKIGRNIEKQVETAYVNQDLDFLPKGFNVPEGREKPWGTAHAVLTSRNEVETPFAVINADDFYGASAYKTLCNFLRDAEDIGGVGNYCNVGYILKNTLSEHGHVARGVCRADENSYLKEIHERLNIRKFGDQVKYTEDGEKWIEEPPESLVSMNMWGFTLSLFKYTEEAFPVFLKENINKPKTEFLLPEVVGDLVKGKKVKVRILKTDEMWYGITYKEDKPYVEKAVRSLIDRGAYPEKLWQT